MTIENYNIKIHQEEKWEGLDFIEIYSSSYGYYIITFLENNKKLYLKRWYGIYDDLFNIEIKDNNYFIQTIIQ